MTSEKLKPTPGPWRIDRFLGALVGQEGRVIGGEEDLLLCAEAGTVHHECGLSPRELLEGYRELRKQLDEMSDLAIKVDSWESFPQRPINSACAANAKHKEV